jgi:UDP-N-acetylmuramyl tripeptide synthase
MRFASIIIGKTVLKLSRLTGGNGTAAPGLVVEKLHPRFLRTMLTQLPHGVLLITGTNGKTTTTKMTVALLESQGLRVLTNKTGSNFVRGTVTAVVDKASWYGKLRYDVAVFELDEAHAVHFVHQVKPKGVVVLNVMRDQMDRFGEIDTTTKLLQKVAENATDWVLLNANDERVSTIRLRKDIQSLWYGHSRALQKDFLTDDQLHHHDDLTYLVAGKMTAELTSFNSSKIDIELDGHTTIFKTSLDGGHNALNLTAALAITATVVNNLDMPKLHHAARELQPAFGRGEIIKLKNGNIVTLQLVKNPGGFTQALRMLNLHTYDHVAIAINDDYADGRDVSWLWDVDFKVIRTAVITGGTRGYDMAVRLKYDDVATAMVALELHKFVEAVSETNGSAIVFCTYTAMLAIRDLYKKLSDDVYGVRV